MRILIVEDDEIKANKIQEVISETISGCKILLAYTKTEAMNVILAEDKINLLLLDLNLPNRRGESPKRYAGLSLLKEISRRSNIRKPNHIIGLTSYSDIQKEVEESFRENGWLLIRFNPKKADWEETIKNKLLYIQDSFQAKTHLTKKDNKDLALIMKGGGIKGLAYVGALEVLTKYYDFNWYAGTSAGAISAILLGAGYDYKELKEILENKNFEDFKDASPFRMIFNLLLKGGFYEADSFTNWLQELLSIKLDSPTEVLLKDLKARVSVYASTKSRRALIYDSNDPAFNTTPAAFAARCSMSIPFVFVPQENHGKRVFDGGVQNNYPVDILLRDNQNAKFIGLYIGNEYFRGDKKSSSLFDLLNIWKESSDIESLREHKDSTIIIDTNPISTLQFKLSKEEKEFLLECGRVYSMRFVAKNHPDIIENDALDKKKKNLEILRNNLVFKKQKRTKKRKVIFLLISFFTVLSLVLFWIWRDSTSVNKIEDPNNIEDEIFTNSGERAIEELTKSLLDKEPKKIHPGLSLEKGVITELRLFPTDIIKVIYGKGLDSLNTGLGWQKFTYNKDGYIIAGETGKRVVAGFKGEGVIKMVVEITNYKDSIRGTEERPWH